MAKDKLSVTINPDVVEQIDLRAERIEEEGRRNGLRSPIISRDLDRYYETLRQERSRLRKMFTQQEINLILDNLNGVWLREPALLSMTGIGINIQDGIEIDNLDKKWVVSGPDLIEKINNLNFAALCALADSVERWWNRTANQENPVFEDALAD